jgi:hypothetical protein
LSHVETGGDAKHNNTTKAIACGEPNTGILVCSGKICVKRSTYVGGRNQQ